MNSLDSAWDLSIKREGHEDISIKQEEAEDLSIKQEKPEDISIKQEESADQPHLSTFHVPSFSFIFCFLL